MLKDILTTFCIHSAFDPVQQRNICLEYINRAAKDLYNDLEADSLLREVVLSVPSGVQISLPPFIGELRGCREYNWSTLVPINEIGVPRFSSDTQKFRWRNWTMKNKVALANTLSAAGPLYVNFPAVESIPTIVNITGVTANGQSITERVPCDGRTPYLQSGYAVITINSWKSITSIIVDYLTPLGGANAYTGQSGRLYDINFYDINNNWVATLYNNEIKTEYRIVDVSLYTWVASFGDGSTTLMEVLYKTKFYKLFNDTDEFVSSSNFDDAISYRAISLWALNQDSTKLDLAKGMLALSEKAAQSVIENDEKGQKRKIQHGKNKVYDVHRKLRIAGYNLRNYWINRYW